MGAPALGAAAYAVKAVSLTHSDQPECVQEEIRWQVANLSGRERTALRLLPPLGADQSGPLGAGLLSRGVLGATIRQIQTHIDRPSPAFTCSADTVLTPVPDSLAATGEPIPASEEAS